MEFPYPPQIASLPIAPHLDSICNALRESSSRFLVLTAQTAAGKSTALPLALLNHFKGRILMLEPRRLAVLSIANRVSSLLGEEPGGTCGYRMHLESRTGRGTRFCVMTEAVLVRALQDDPLLEGVSVVVLDEFHERSVHADLALSFLMETMALRDDFFVIVMSATMQTKKLCGFLDAPLFEVPGKQFPVAVEYAGHISMAEAVRRELAFPHDDGTVLAFLPGISEIRRTKAELDAMGLDAELCVLHSSVDFSEQKRLLLPAGKSRRVILSSAISETSLTVPGVTVVIDGGLCRRSEYNARLGMETLVTSESSLFNAEQRAGRAGRTKSGTCIRLYDKHDVRPVSSPPQILTADLAQLVLECAEWGSGSLSKDGLRWLDAPPDSSWRSAVELLVLLGCLASDGAITRLGKACLSLGMHPRLSCVALHGLPFGMEEKSVELCAEYSPSVPMAQPLRERFLKDTLRRVRSVPPESVPLGQGDSSVPYCDAAAVLAGFPDRICVHVGDGTYQFPSGRKARMSSAVPPFPQYVVAPDVDAGETTGRMYSWLEVPRETAEAFLVTRSETNERSFFEPGTTKLRTVRECSYGKIVLWKKECKTNERSFVNAVCDAVSTHGISWLPIGEETERFLVRAEFFSQHGGESDVLRSFSEKLRNLGSTPEEWLSPFLSGSGKLTEKTVGDALRWYLDGASVDESVPNAIVLVPGTKPRRILYIKQNGIITPTVEIIIQQAFGCFSTPRILGVPIVFRLLSPARRPLQVTSDLEHFWEETWPQICGEMKARYPKHNWDYRIPEKESPR